MRTAGVLKQQVRVARIQEGRPALTSFLIVDAQGLRHAIEVTTANVIDRQGTLQAVDRCQAHLTHVQSVLVGGGYTGGPFAQAISAELGVASVQVAKRSVLPTFAVIPKHWVVERSFAWLEKCRRIWKNCERQLNTSLQFMHLAFLVLLLRRS